MIRSALFHHERSIWLRAGRNLKRYAHTQSIQSETRRKYLLKIFGLVFLSGLGLSVPLYIHLAGNPGPGSPQRTFRNYKLEGKEAYSSTSSIITLKAPSNVDWAQQWQKGLWSIEIKQPQLQIAREYTPLPCDLLGNDEDNIRGSCAQDNSNSLELWIRREPSGEVSNYLHKLELGSVVEVRGPKSLREIPIASEIVFLAGGTGIGPAFQLAHLLFERYRGSDDLPTLHILWANRRREDCAGGLSDHVAPTTAEKILNSLGLGTVTAANETKSVLVKRLDKLKEAFKGRLTIDYFVDEEGTRISEQRILNRLRQARNMVGECPKPIVMVCGPDGFVAHFAGLKQWQNGKQIQGRLSGVLQDANRLGWEVIKL